MGRTACIACFSASALLGFVEPAHAQPANDWAALESQDAGEVGAAIMAVGRDGGYRALNALGDRIRDGLPPRLLDQAIDVLIRLGRGPGSRILVELSRHRRNAVRAKVADGLVATRAPNARRELTRMLDDPSPAVRSAAARALGELGARAAMNELIAAARRGNPEAAAIVGAQATSYQATRLLVGLEEEDLRTFGPVLRAFAGRQDLPRGTRLRVVARLGELGSPTCMRLLSQLASELDQADPVRTAAEEAIAAARTSEEQTAVDEPAPAEPAAPTGGTPDA